MPDYKVLMVEDEKGLIAAFARIHFPRRPDIQFIIAETPEETMRLFAEHTTTLDLCTMDGTLIVNGTPHDTNTLVDLMREAGYRGPIIAASSDPKRQEALRLPGRCDDECNEKRHLPDMIFKLLPKKG